MLFCGTANFVYALEQRNAVKISLRQTKLLLVFLRQVICNCSHNAEFNGHNLNDQMSSDPCWKVWWHVELFQHNTDYYSRVKQTELAYSTHCTLRDSVECNQLRSTPLFVEGSSTHRCMTFRSLNTSQPGRRALTRRRCTSRNPSSSSSAADGTVAPSRNTSYNLTCIPISFLPYTIYHRQINKQSSTIARQHLQWPGLAK